MKSIRRYLTSLILVVALVIGMMPGMALPTYAADDHDGWKVVNTNNDIISYEGGLAIIPPGNYFLANDLTLTETLYVRGEVRICLHSAEIRNSVDLYYLICVEEGGNLTIEDCGAGTGSIANSSPSAYGAIFNEGTLNISGGNIGSMKKGIQTENGTVNISNGRINGNDEAIYMTGGKLNISGATEIIGPKCGLYAQGGTINIDGGEIRSTIAGTSGMTLTDFASAFIYNGTISGIKYGVHATNSSNIFFSGGEIQTEDTTAIYFRSGVLMICKDDPMNAPFTKGGIDADGGTIDISGGYFSDDPTAYLDETCKVVSSSYTDYPYEVVEKDKYNVTFTDGAGNVLSNQAVHEGLAATAPAAPTRAGWIFAGWDKAFSNITTDLTVNATWTAAPVVAPTEIQDLPAVKITKPAAAKKSVNVKWKKVSKKNQKKIGGIEIQVATDSAFTDIVKSTTASKKKTSKKIKGLKSKKTYWVRIRAYKNAADGKHVSAWKTKTIKTK